MRADPWAALQQRRQRRHWRSWPWGWIALGLSVGAWACAFALMVLVLASVGMPGDGNHAMQATRLPMLGVLCVAATTVAGCLVAAGLSLRLPHRPVAGAMALGLLALLVAVMVLPSLL